MKTWKYHHSLGNTTYDLETPLYTWKYDFQLAHITDEVRKYDKEVGAREFPKLICKFPS